ncbi:MAG TPA: hypothetical protein VG605_16715 [Puia sp.]|nr:hypothetical protein [Puia sp.]
MGDRELIEGIQKITRTQLSDDVRLEVCTVESVDVPSRTCIVSMLIGQNTTEIPDVLLMAEVDDGFILIPAEGSTVVIARSTYNQPFVVLFSQLQTVLFSADNIQFNDGSYGGLTKTPELRAQLDKTTALLQAVVDIINGPPISEPGSGSPSALQTALKSAIAGQELGDYSEIENTIITHGA